MIGVGDIVLCVDDVPRDEDCSEFPWTIKRGGIYRIVDVHVHPVHGLGVNLNVDPPHLVSRHVWYADRFRKIRPADPEFAEQMRGLRNPVTSQPVTVREQFEMECG